MSDDPLRRVLVSDQENIEVVNSNPHAVLMHSLPFWASVDFSLEGKSARVAGRVSACHIAGIPFVQVDLPPTAFREERQLLLGQSSIYSIIPLDEEKARRLNEFLPFA